MTLRVLYLARAPFVSGAERALESLLRHLDRAQVQAGVVLGQTTPLVESLQAQGWPVWACPLPRRSLGGYWPWRRSVRRLRAIVREFQPDLLHANDVPSCQAMSVLGAQHHLPTVIHVRWTITAADMAWWARDGATAVLCISQWIRDQLGDPRNTTLASSRFVVLPDCVDWPAQAAATECSATPPSHHGGAEGEAGKSQASPLRLGFAGQLIASKGLDTVLRALGRLPVHERPLLKVAGKDTQTGGRYEQELRTLAEREGVAQQVQWLGFLPNVDDLYQQVDAMVCPSREEPLGLVPLEAARESLPTLAHRVGGLAETIVDGQTGWLVDLDDLDGWARAFRQAADANLRRQLGQAAHARTLSHYAPATYHQRLLALYHDCVGKPAPANPPR